LSEIQTRRCRECGSEQPLDRGHFYWRRQSRAFHTLCKACFCRDQQARYAAHRAGVPLPTRPGRTSLSPEARRKQRLGAAARRRATQRLASMREQPPDYPVVPATASTITYTETAHWLGISKPTISRAVRQGVLQAFVVPPERPRDCAGVPVVLLRHEVERWHEERRQLKRR
jgi:hypothetical protein